MGASDSCPWPGTELDESGVRLKSDTGSTESLNRFDRCTDVAQPLLFPRLTEERIRRLRSSDLRPKSAACHDVHAYAQEGGELLGESEHREKLDPSRSFGFEVDEKVDVAGIVYLVTGQEPKTRILRAPRVSRKLEIRSRSRSRSSRRSISNRDTLVMIAAGAVGRPSCEQGARAASTRDPTGIESVQ